MARRTDVVKFRYSGAIVVVVVLTAISALPLALSRWELVPVLLVPLMVGLWVVRAGVDANSAGIVVRSALGSRRLTWAEITGFTATGDHVAADLAGGGSMVLPTIRPPDMPRLMAAGSQQLDRLAE